VPRAKNGTASIPRRLRELGFASYGEYLQSRHWQGVRRRFWARANGNVRCEACGGTGKMSLHHKTYKRLGRERPMDLMALCGRCHDLVHSFHGENLWAHSEYLRKSFLRNNGQQP
jgi:hypothetical protein